MNRWLYIGIGAVLFVLGGVGGIVLSRFTLPCQIVSPIGTFGKQVRPLDEYTIEALSKRQFTPQPITFADPIATESGFVVKPFFYSLGTKRISGLAHIPMTAESKKMPVIVQIRGFVDPTIYEQGVGTKRSAEVFAKNGFLSLAPDFFGYGQSDGQSNDVFEDRFQTYTAVLQLLADVSTIGFADPERIFLWGHSNGGQIALTTLAITGKPIPTVLWAPVTKPFPYSILYYTDEFDDGGKELRRRLAIFEAQYKADLYSFTNYIERIMAPIQLHQGSADDAVPLVWSQNFVKSLEDKGKQAELFVYPGADHNLSDGAASWNTAVIRAIDFYRSFIR